MVLARRRDREGSSPPGSVRVQKGNASSSGFGFSRLRSRTDKERWREEGEGGSPGERRGERGRANHLESKSVGKKNKLGGSNNKEICFSSVRARAACLACFVSPFRFCFSLSPAPLFSRNEKRETDEAVCAAARYALTIRAIFLFRAKHPRFLNRSFSLSLSLSLEHAFPGSTWPPLRVCRGDDTTVRATVRHDNRRGIIVFAACHAAVTPARKLSHYSDGGRGVGGGNRNTTAAAAAARPVKNFKPTKL